MVCVSYSCFRYACKHTRTYIHTHKRTHTYIYIYIYRYKHIETSDETLKEKMENDKKIALCLQGEGAQEEKLKRIMTLPESLRQKARVRGDPCLFLFILFPL